MTDKKINIKALAEKINKKFKSTTLVVGSELTDFELIKTPFASVNALVGGLPRGRFSTIAGQLGLPTQ